MNNSVRALLALEGGSASVSASVSVFASVSVSVSVSVFASVSVSVYVYVSVSLCLSLSLSPSLICLQRSAVLLVPSHAHPAAHFPEAHTLSTVLYCTRTRTRTQHRCQSRRIIARARKTYVPYRRYRTDEHNPGTRIRTVTRACTKD